MPDQHDRADLGLDRYLTVHEAARLLRASARTVQRECATGRITAARFGRAWLIDHAALEAQLEAATNQTGARALDASLGR